MIFQNLQKIFRTFWNVGNLWKIFENLHKLLNEVFRSFLWSLKISENFWNLWKCSKVNPSDPGFCNIVHPTTTPHQTSSNIQNGLHGSNTFLPTCCFRRIQYVSSDTVGWYLDRRMSQFNNILHHPTGCTNWSNMFLPTMLMMLEEKIKPIKLLPTSSNRVYQPIQYVLSNNVGWC